MIEDFLNPPFQEINTTEQSLLAMAEYQAMIKGWYVEVLNLNYRKK